MIASVQNNKSSVVTTSNLNAANTISKSHQPAFNGIIELGGSDDYCPSEINYERFATLITQEVPMEKISAIYEDMLDSPGQTFFEKIMTTKAKISRKIQHRFAPELVEENMLYGFAQTIGSIVPKSLKVERGGAFFDLPHNVNSSIINIINSVDNYGDFYDSVDMYFEDMKSCGYDKNSDLPVVTGVNADKDYLSLQYDSEPINQND